MTTTEGMVPTGQPIPGIGVAGGSGEMFDRIAQRYDLLNRLMSLGLDVLWRRALVRSLGLGPRARVLDLATGTADVCITIARHSAGATVVGVDPSVRMLAVGERKLDRLGMGERVQLLTGDAQSLPFATGGFDATAMAFGIRNVPDRVQALREMNRVTKAGGRIGILELTEPEDIGIFGRLSRFHVHQVVPRMGAFLAGWAEYRYLQKSIAAFPAPRDFVAQMEEAGLQNPRLTRMSFGAVHLFVAEATGEERA